MTPTSAYTSVTGPPEIGTSASAGKKRGFQISRPSRGFDQKWRAVFPAPSASGSAVPAVSPSMSARADAAAAAVARLPSVVPTTAFSDSRPTPPAAIPVSTPASVSQSLSQNKGRVLVVDDDLAVLRSFARVLRGKGFDANTAPSGEAALELIEDSEYDVIISDISMPGMSGMQLLQRVRGHDLDVPVILVTGEPAVSTAVQALEYGAFHYLTKPVEPKDLEEIVDKGICLHRMARMKREAAEILGGDVDQAGDRAGLEASFERAMQTLWVAYQPILNARTQRVFGYEGLLRSNEPSLPHPGAVLDAAERLDQLEALGRRIRDRAAEPMSSAPDDTVLFVNLHTTDLLDPRLLSGEAPLSKIAHRVVLEITERASLDDVKDTKGIVARLRELGFRIAIDDLGAGYAGLTSFATLEPEIVKLDMTLVRDVHASATKQKLIRSMTQLCKDMGMLVVAEGIETAAERDALIELGCDLLQGFKFAKPGKPFPEVAW